MLCGAWPAPAGTGLAGAPLKAQPRCTEMLKIRIETISHDRQRYPTVGDYWDDPDGTLQVRISEVGDRRLELLVALHELIECELCRQRGIAEPDIMAFDLAFEKEIEAGECDEDEEPGDDP